MESVFYVQLLHEWDEFIIDAGYNQRSQRLKTISEICGGGLWVSDDIDQL
jgi:hypothetical protein